MKKFAFKMEKLLEIREFKEREKSLELAEVTGRYIDKKNEITRFKELRKQILTKRFSYADNNSGADPVFTDTQISAIREKITALKKALKEIEAEREEIRAEYLEALKDKKVLEKLKDKRMSEHEKEERSKEDKALDDISVTRFTVKLQEV